MGIDAAARYAKTAGYIRASLRLKFLSKNIRLSADTNIPSSSLRTFSVRSPSELIKVLLNCRILCRRQGMKSVDDTIHEIMIQEFR